MIMMSEILIVTAGVVIEGSAVFAICVIFMAHYKTTIANDRKIIMALRQKVESKEKLFRQEQKRRGYHRIELNGEPCTVRVIDFGEQTLRSLNNKSFEVEMLDISQNNMNIHCSIDFPIRKEVHLLLSFSKKDGTMIQVKGKVMRKEIRHDRLPINYEIQFIHLTAKEETEIQSFMNQKELSKRAMNAIRGR